MRDISIKVKGRTELLMHNSRLVNPMDEATKSLRDAQAEWKRAKTEAAFAEMCRADFFGSMYHSTAPDGTVIGPYFPSDNFHAALKAAGAKIVKKGRTTFKNFVAAGLLPGESDINPLTYKSFHGTEPAPRDLEGLWKDGNYADIRPAGIGKSKIMRTRPKFANWTFEVPYLLDTDVLDPEDLDRVLVIAGQVVGIGDWRPEKGGRRGRFTAEVIDRGEWLGEAAA